VLFRGYLPSFPVFLDRLANFVQAKDNLFGELCTKIDRGFCHTTLNAARSLQARMPALPASGMLIALPDAALS
jgi:hypothetical protein